MLCYILFGLFFALLAIFYLHKRKLFGILFRDCRPLRIGYFQLSLLLGVAVALSQKPISITYYFRYNSGVLLNILLVMISITFAAFFSIMVNNIYDIEIDEISNPGRPLPSKEFNLRNYTQLAYVSMLLALLYAASVNARTFLSMAAVISLYYFYSAPPVRFKRVFIISKLAVSMSAFILLDLGVHLVADGWRQYQGEFFLIYLIGITLASNVIDLKDTAGDKAMGIMTLPVVIGEDWAKLLLGIVLLLLSLSYYYIFQDVILLPALAGFGMVFFYLLNKSDYEDWKVVLLSNSGLLVMITYLLWRT